MSTLVITRGLPASGKSTWSRQWVTDAEGRVRVNRDDLRAMLFNRTTGLTIDQEQQVTDAERGIATRHLKAGRDVVVDAMNLRPRYVREWRKLATAAGAEFHVQEFPTTVDDAVARDTAREHGVGEAAIRSIAAKYLPGGRFIPVPDEQEPAPPDAYAPPRDGIPAIICDIDGTAALMGDRDPYDITTVANDAVNEPVRACLNAMHDAGHQIIYCSGRSDEARADTAAWIARHGLPDGPLIMRARDDRRRDSVVKRELFDTHIRDTYDVKFVLDDRQQVVDMWRDLGLPVFQVAPGDF